MNVRLTISILSLLSLTGGAGSVLFAQSDTLPHTNLQLQVSDMDAVPVSFAIDADLSQYAIPEAPLLWGMDVAWDSQDNVRRGTNYITKADLSVGRVSFQPSDLVGEDDQLSAAQKSALQRRLDHIAISGVKDLILNCDHEVLCNKDNYPNCDTNYANYYGKPQEWLKVIRASVKYCRSKGFNVVTISPFNEPDYTAWKEGTKAHFKEIARLISEDSELQGIRISAGNTLNCDQAASWYTAVKPYATEGNTHQLAGSFKTYADFWTMVRKDGNHATADELHNVGEAFIGAHYGMQTGVWWGWDGAARGEYCKASRHGKEIGYGENRDAWTAATVYKREDGRIDGFLGTSERQANTSSYEFISSDHPAYFDGKGPYYTYQVTMPGGTGYQQGQINAERMVLIHHGEDVPLDPVEAGRSYVIMNAHSSMCMGTYSNSTNSGVTVAQRRYGQTPTAYYQWMVDALPSGSGGDQGYFVLRWGKNTNMVLDVTNWSTSAGGGVIAITGGLGTNEQWFVEYAGNNFWYIRSRHSGLYLEVRNAATTADAVIQQANFSGADCQKWRFIPVEGKPKLEQVAPAAPTGLKAEARSASVVLTWDANTEEDLAGYAVVRDGDMIARLVTGTSFIDNDVRAGVQHHYSLRAIDQSRNLSEASEPIEVSLSAQPALVLHYTFEQDTLDMSGNLLSPRVSGKPNYNTMRKKEGEYSLLLNSNSRFIALPPSVGYFDEMTFALWVYVSSSSAWQRIFDFGNGTDQYIFLTPSNGSEMRLVFKNKGEEQILSGTRLTTGWHHIAVTLSPEAVTLYADDKVYTSTDITLRPSDILPKRNYIGRSQFVADPTFSGYIDDVRLYNCPLTAEQVAQLREGEEPIVTGIKAIESLMPAEETLYRLDGSRTESLRGLVISRQGKRLYR